MQKKYRKDKWETKEVDYLQDMGNKGVKRWGNEVSDRGEEGMMLFYLQLVYFENLTNVLYNQKMNY